MGESRKKAPARAVPKADKAGRADKVLLEGLQRAFTDEERRQILARALLGLGRAGQKRLCAELGPTGEVLAPLLGVAPARKGTKSAVSPQRFEESWKTLWREWDAIVEKTDDPDGPYIQNEISYTTPDLACSALATDLDRVAAKLLPLVPPRLASPGPKPFDLARKLASSLGKIAPSHTDYLLMPDDGFELGPSTTKLALTWLWATGAQQGRPPAATLDRLAWLCEQLAESEPGAYLNEKALRAFFRALGAAERKRLREALEQRKGREPWKQAFDEGWGPCLGLVEALTGAG